MILRMAGDAMLLRVMQLDRAEDVRPQKARRGGSPRPADAEAPTPLSRRAPCGSAPSTERR